MVIHFFFFVNEWLLEKFHGIIILTPHHNNTQKNMEITVILFKKYCDLNKYDFQKYLFTQCQRFSAEAHPSAYYTAAAKIR